MSLIVQIQLVFSFIYNTFSKKKFQFQLNKLFPDELIRINDNRKEGNSRITVITVGTRKAEQAC